MNILNIINEEIYKTISENNNSNYDIESIILQVIDEYNEHPKDINNGSCWQFARDVLSEMGYEDESTFNNKNQPTHILEVQMDFGGGSNGWFKNPDGSYVFEKYNGRFPNNLLNAVEQDIEKFKNEYNRWLNPNANGIDKFRVGDHYWIYHNGKHYDAETPKGKINPFELPIFKRYINYFLTRYK